MNISYSSSLWNKDGQFYGFAQKTDWFFEHKGIKRCIPCIYRFREGIVFDLLTFLDEEKVRIYVDKFRDRQNKLTESEIRAAERESPFKGVEIKDLFLNDVKMEGNISSSSITITPFIDNNEETAISLKNNYRKQLGTTTCFLCQRYKVPYPKSVSMTEKLLRKYHMNKIHSVKITTLNTQDLYPVHAAVFISEQEVEAELKFKNPIDELEYKLNLRKLEEFEIPSHKQQPMLYVTKGQYGIEPPLPHNQKLNFDSSIKFRQQSTDETILRHAASVGIIGGSTGPSAIFIPDKNKSTGSAVTDKKPVYDCLSRVTQTRQEQTEFCIQGVTKTIKDSMTYVFYK